MTREELLDRLYETVEDHAANPEHFQPADLDEILLIANSIRDLVAPKFNAVAEGYDKAFDHNHGAKQRMLNRLVRILRVSGNLPDTLPEENPTPELVPEFSLPKREKERVLKLSEDMRKIVFSSTVFDEPHKRRLLNRIAAIEHEVHQPNGKLDVVLAGVVDVGDALGKFGQKVEPLTKRMKEIADLTRGRSKQYEQIPAPEEVKSLPAPDESSEED